MTKTELSLLALYRSPVVRLEDISRAYFNMDYKTAQDRAALNSLGVPTFRLSESRKSPLVISVSDLASYIDAKASQARDRWETSQV